jgi:hypothetical protein
MDVVRSGCELKSSGTGSEQDFAGCSGGGNWGAADARLRVWT